MRFIVPDTVEGVGATTVSSNAYANREWHLCVVRIIRDVVANRIVGFSDFVFRFRIAE